MLLGIIRGALWGMSMTGILNLLAGAFRNSLGYADSDDDPVHDRCPVCFGCHSADDGKTFAGGAEGFAHLPQKGRGLKSIILSYRKV